MRSLLSVPIDLVALFVAIIAEQLFALAATVRGYD